MTKDEFYHVNVSTVRAFMQLDHDVTEFELGTSDIFTDTTGNMNQILEIAYSKRSFLCSYSKKDEAYQIIEYAIKSNHNVKGNDLKSIISASEKLVEVDPISNHRFSEVVS